MLHNAKNYRSNTETSKLNQNSELWEEMTLEILYHIFSAIISFLSI